VADPNPIARGGAQALQEAGIEAIHQPNSTMEFEQRAWLHRITTGRPLITAKVAITLDGYIAAEDGTSQWITSEASREDVQHLRAQVGAVITSTETFLNDQPSLLPRIANAPTPLRVVMGTRDISSTQFTHLKSHEITELIELLNNEGINHALVESGGKFLASLIKGDVVDELVIYQAPKLLGAGKKWVEALGINSLPQALTWELLGTERICDDVKSHYRRVRG
jgi:diaminohydroxyphosphoribosylaminopyrimidine deaminase/5-amino-6-(5-phosphoribosylamino)uracil reductase